MLDAQALLMAASKNVVRAERFVRWLPGRMDRLSVSKKKKVREGLRVRIREAEYPDQKPRKPFSFLIWSAIDRTESWFKGLEGERADSMDEVCFRVTMVAIGVVRNLEKAPAKNPTLSSSSTVRCFEDDFADRSRDCRRKL